MERVALQSFLRCRSLSLCYFLDHKNYIFVSSILGRRFSLRRSFFLLYAETINVRYAIMCFIYWDGNFTLLEEKCPCPKHGYLEMTRIVDLRIDRLCVCGVVLIVIVVDVYDPSG